MYIELDPAGPVVVVVSVSTDTNTTVTGVATAVGETMTVSVPNTGPSEPATPGLADAGMGATLTTVTIPDMVLVACSITTVSGTVGGPTVSGHCTP